MDEVEPKIADNYAEIVQRCPMLTTLSIIGGKWKLAIVYQLHLSELLRFGELRSRLPKITQKMLTQQLRELEADQIVARKVYAEVPPRVEYSLTPRGESLREVIQAMTAWGSERLSQKK